MFLNEWMLASRIRFALVQTAISVGIVLGISALTQGIGSLADNLWFTLGVLLLAFVLNALVWYPRAKRRLTAQRG